MAREYLANHSQQNSDYTVRGKATDDEQNPLGSDRLVSLTLSVYALDTLAVINGLENIGILNTGRGSVDALGNVKVKLTSLDNPIVNDQLAEERHLILLKWTWLEVFNGVGVTRSGSKELVLTVDNVTMVP